MQRGGRREKGVLSGVGREAQLGRKGWAVGEGQGRCWALWMGLCS